MKQVLLLGDSIRMAYQETVRSQLSDCCTVEAPEENGRFAAYTLNSLRFWLRKWPHPDLIHWNNGLWDLCILYPEDGCFTPLNEYLRSLSRILRELRATGAQVIFATSTPVRQEKELLTGPFPPCIHRSDVVRYNAAARRLMEQEGALIDDLFPVLDGRTRELITDDLTHPNEEGALLLGSQVASFIRNTLKGGGLS